jgi:hypothetical protein
MLSYTTLPVARRAISMRGVVAAILLFSTLAVGLTACAPSATSDPVAAMRINGTIVSLSSYQQLLKLFDASAALQSAGSSSPIAWQSPGSRQTLLSAKAETVNFFTNTLIIKQQLDAQHISVTPANIQAATAQLDAQIAQAQTQYNSNPTNTGLKALLDAATPDAIRWLAEQQAYTVSLAEKGFVPTVQTRGILVSAKPQADTLMADIKNGQDFAALAKAHSLDTASAAKGGDLGTIYPGQLVAGFDKAVFKDLKGTGVVLVALGTGYGIFDITARSLSPLSTLKNSQTQQQYLSSWVTNVLMPEATVDLYAH